MDPAALDYVTRIGEALGANPAVIFVGYLLVRELREWRAALTGINNGLSTLANAVNAAVADVLADAQSQRRRGER